MARFFNHAFGHSLTVTQSLQFTKHDAIAAVTGALGHGEPYCTRVLTEGRILKGVFGFEPVFALPRHTITRDLYVEDFPPDTAAILNA